MPDNSQTNIPNPVMAPAAGAVSAAPTASVTPATAVPSASAAPAAGVADTPVAATAVAPSAPVASAAPAAPVAPAPEPAPVVDEIPTAPAVDDLPTAPAEDQEAKVKLLTEVAEKISEAHNILVALSSDPSVDDLAAAIGLSLYLDRLGKRATAIYSGATPNALEFLKPEQTLEPTTDTLQDFVIALDKEKADHLRYKLDGDFVKIYITPYKARIAEEDLEFSYGDYNVDLVLALDVASGADLDSALREHGRIMHDATIINITTAHPGKFGEIEWSDPRASSVSEMIADLLYGVSSKIEINAEEATAFLTGIIAATDRFSSPSTTPVTLQIASSLMTSGADQQLITQNISEDGDKIFTLTNSGLRVGRKEDDATSLEVEHDEDAGAAPEASSGSGVVVPTSSAMDTGGATGAGATSGTNVTNVANVTEPELPDLKEAVESLTSAAAAGSLEAPAASDLGTPAPAGVTVSPSLPSVSDGARADAEALMGPKPEKIVAPSPDFMADVAQPESTDRYSKMLTEALAEGANPAASFAPPVAVNPEINGVPEINYMPLPSDQVLPPPPAPPIDMNSPLPTM